MLAPPVPRKPDSDAIVEFLRELASQDWIRRSEKSWWPRFIFHFTDIRNAAQILADEEIRCRSLVEGIDHVDSASPGVIAGTPDYVHGYVRFYFRPRTPTQFHMEGIRAQQDISHFDAHCPVPVFFLFDSNDVLTRADSSFTEGSLARQVHPPELRSTARELREFPFQMIYHTGAFDPATQSEITFHRQAEVVVPQRIGLDALQHIFCRTAAEKDTLLSLLPGQTLNRYQSRIRVATRAQLYEKRWTFVEDVRLSSGEIVVSFSPDSTSPGPFHARFALENLDTDISYPQEIQDFYTNAQGLNPLIITPPPDQRRYRFRIELDGHLAYQNEYEEITF
jgi:hypothetical protein